MRTVFGFFDFVRELFIDRKIIFGLSKNDFKSKYTNSLFGIAWAFVLPLIIILVLWFVFQVGFKSVPVDGVPFILWYIPAFLAWNFYSEALGTASACIFDYSYLVKNMQFRVSALPIVKIISSSFVHFFFIAFIFFIYCIYGWFPNIYNIQIVYYYFCTVMLLIGSAWLFSSLAVFSKDILNLIQLIVQVGFWTAPLIWNPDTLPLNVKRAFQVLPTYYICAGYRETFSDRVWFWEHPILTLYFWAFVLIQMIIGAYVFHKLRPQFADML